MTERTPTELPVTQKCYLLIFAFLTEYSTFLKRLTHFLKKLSPFLKSLTNDCASHMRFCMRSYVHCPECIRVFLFLCPLAPNLLGHLPPATCPVLGGVPDNARVMGCTCGSSPSQFPTIGFSSRGYPASNSAPLIRHFVLSNLRNLKVVL